MNGFPVGAMIRPCRHSDDPMKFAKVMREALDRDGQWTWDISGKVDLSGLDGKVREICQRFNDGFTGHFAPKLLVYRGEMDLYGMVGVEYRQVEPPSHDYPYSIEVERWSDHPIVHQYALDAHHCDQLLAAASQCIVIWSSRRMLVLTWWMWRNCPTPAII